MLIIWNYFLHFNIPYVFVFILLSGKFCLGVWDGLQIFAGHSLTFIEKKFFSLKAFDLPQQNVYC